MNANTGKIALLTLCIEIELPFVMFSFGVKLSHGVYRSTVERGQSPWSSVGDKDPLLPKQKTFQLAFERQTEAANVAHSPYFANWRVQFQT